jgi:hypothetical protein
MGAKNAHETKVVPRGGIASIDYTIVIIGVFTGKPS